MGARRSSTSAPRLRHGLIAVLGIVTICCYGAWYYAFGVLIGPVLEATSWRESAVTSAFGAGLFATGVGSVLGGRLLDRWGPRRVFGVAAALASLGMTLASIAQSPWLFALGTALALGALGSLTFYHVTMTTVVRLHPESPERAIAALTIWGAFASPIYLPVTAWLVQQTSWRTTVQILAASAVASLLMAIAVLPRSVEAAEDSARPAMRELLRRIVRRPTSGPDPRPFTVAVSLMGVVVAVALAYQVPVMTAVGLPLATASTMGGLRGLAQLGGRLPLGFLVERFGSRRSLLLALWAIAVGSLSLAFASSIVVASVFVLLVGFGIGAYSPLQGMYASRLFDPESLGATMGIYASIGALSGAVGPAVAGVVAEQTGDRRWVVLLITVPAAAAATSLSRTPGPTPEETPQPTG